MLGVMRYSFSCTKFTLSPLQMRARKNIFVFVTNTIIDMEIYKTLNYVHWLIKEYTRVFFNVIDLSQILTYFTA